MQRQSPYVSEPRAPDKSCAPDEPDYDSHVMHRGSVCPVARCGIEEIKTEKPVAILHPVPPAPPPHNPPI